MYNRYFRIGLFQKYFYSYILVLLIPTFILISFVYRSFMVLLNDEYTSNNMDRLVQVKNEVDEKFRSLKTVAQQISNNPELTRQKLDIGTYNHITAIKTLQNYILPVDFVEEIILFFSGDNRLYSSNGVYLLNYFCETIYRYKGLDTIAYRKMLEESSLPFTRPAENVEVINAGFDRFITHVIPINPGVNGAYSSVVYMIRESAIKKILKGTYSDEKSMIFILDGNNMEVTSVVDDQSKGKILLNRIPPDINDGMLSLHLPGEGKIHLTQVKSDLSGWRFIIAVPEKEITGKLEQMRRYTYYVVAIVMLLGCIAISLFMNINYKPLNQLKRVIEDLTQNKAQKGSEIDFFKLTLNRISGSNHDLKKQIEKGLPAVRDSLLKDLLKGRFESLDEFNDSASEADLRFTKSYFTAALLQTQSDELQICDVLSRSRNNIESSGLEWYPLEGMIDDTVILIIASDKDQHAEMAIFFKSVQDHVRKALGIEITIGAGNPHSRIGEIGKSYIEASTSLDYCILKGKNRIIWFNELDDKRHVVKEYPYVKLGQLELALLQRDLKKTATIGLEIAACIRENDLPLFAARLVCFDVINVLLKTLRSASKDISFDGIHLPEMLSLSRANSNEQLSEQLTKIFCDLYNHLNLSSRTESNEKIDDILTHIRYNFANWDLSVQSIADHFQLSPSNLSHYFKDKTGENISDYILHIRIEEAKTLLSFGHEPVNEIAARVGYEHTTSFIRVFKSLVGLTPGTYRELHSRVKKA